MAPSAPEPASLNGLLARSGIFSSSALDLANSERQLSFQVGAIDRLLHGGLPERGITEIAGER